MKLDQFSWDRIREAAHAVLIDIDQENLSLPFPFPPPKTANELSLYLAGVTFEISLGETLAFTFKALESATQALKRAHDLAKKVLVTDPSAATVQEVAADLQVISKAVAQDQNFHAAVALAGAVADIAKSFQS
jgi:hypothetical protein